MIDRGELRRMHSSSLPMGHQPALDGIRALSVAIVIIYHAGIAWMHGGFFGVEVFFVVSGYLITTLLVDERTARGYVSLRQFWIRRARRLLPALAVMLVAISLWSVFVAQEHATQLRHDLLPSIFYVSNWAQIFGSVPYFSPAVPLLRHLWSLAVEEQWYLVWPVLFIGLQRVMRGRTRVFGALLFVAAIAMTAVSALLTTSNEVTLAVAGRDVDRYNFLYLNTFGRASGLLLGAAVALLWRPWCRPVGVRSARSWRAVATDGAGLAAMAAIVAIAATRDDAILADASLYRLWMPVVTVLSLVAVATSVDPTARLMRTIFGWRPLVAIGQRSYGLYLWHWPVFVFAGVRGHTERMIPALMIAGGLAELSYRLIETPIRRGVIGRWWSTLGDRAPINRRVAVGAALTVTLLVVGGIGASLSNVTAVDVSVGAQQVDFDPTAAGLVSSPTTIGGPSTESSLATGSSVAATAAVTTVTAPTLPRRVTIVGDSEAHSLFRNIPRGLDTTFTISDGSIDGCSVQSNGSVITARRGFRRNFANCSGWEQRWADDAAAARAELALVVLGAWEVFDIDVDGATVVFGTPEADQRFLTGLQAGIDALNAAGVHTALLEVACMRPQDVKGAGVPALPERADDARVAHLNDLLRRAAEANSGTTTFVAGPTQWCADETIASDLGYRWDGVHVYQPGAKLIFETISSSLLAIPL